MNRMFRSFCLSLIGFAVLGTQAWSASWPKDKPITLVVPYAAGADYLWRIINPEMEKRLGQTILVENRAGGGGVTGTAYGARQRPDGYTLVYTAPGPAAMFTNTHPSLPYKIDDFEYVSRLSTSDALLVARKDFPASTAAELLEYAKVHPGAVSFAHRGVGSYNHILGLAMSDKAGIKLNGIPYQSSPQAVTDLLSGSLDLSIDLVNDAYLSQIQAGTIKAIAVFSEQRSKALPDTATLRESGVDMAVVPWIGLMAPKGTPRDIINRINSELKGVLESDETRKKFALIGHTPAPTTPEAFRDLVLREEAMWRDTIKKYGVRVD
jgi:putative tricarboxylic transport membrane protein